MIDTTVCTCGCGKQPNGDYWHAWQAGRAYGWNESYGRPAWWSRLCCYLTDLRAWRPSRKDR